MRTFTDRSIEAIIAKKSVLCVGLDPQFQHMPWHLMPEVVEEYGRTHEGVAELFLRVNMQIIDAVAEHAVWVKPQSAFWERYGAFGVLRFQMLIRYAHENGLIVISDVKRSDGMATAEAYADGLLGEVPFWPEGCDKGDPYDFNWENAEFTTQTSLMNTDAVTIEGYIAEAGVMPYVNQAVKHGKGVFVVCKTSFKPNSLIEQAVLADGRKLWEYHAELIREWGEGTQGEHGWSNVGAVMGATYPDDAPKMQEILPNAWKLIPGFGAQGGKADAAVLCADEDGFGITVNSSRDITAAFLKKAFPDKSENFALSAQKAAIASKEALNAALLRAGKGRAFLS